MTVYTIPVIIVDIAESCKEAANHFNWLPIQMIGMIEMVYTVYSLT